jgi:hypothetical protein
MCDRQNEHSVGLYLKGDQVGKAIENGHPDRLLRSPQVWPQGKEFAPCRDPFQNGFDFGDKLFSEPGFLLVIPKRGSPELRARLLMKYDSHAAAPVR